MSLSPGRTSEFTALARWLSRDKEAAEILISLLKTLVQGSNCEGTGRWPAPTLYRLLKAGLIHEHHDQGHGEPAVGLTELGSTIASFLWQYEPQEELNQVFEKINLAPDCTFLDVGCGAGPVLAGAHRFSPALTVGVDIDLAALLAAKGIANDEITVIQADIANLPFKPGTFSHICCRIVMPYVDQYEAIAEINRVLRKGGTVFLHFHTYPYYLKNLLANLRSVKKVMFNTFCLFNGLLFHLTGRQLLVRFRGKTYVELYQTESGVKRLLRSNGMIPGYLENHGLFRLLATKE